MAEQVQLDSPAARQRPPAMEVGPVGWARAHLFNTWYNALLTVLIAWGLIQLVPAIVGWAVVRAVWAEVPSTVCRQVDGACWAFVREKYRLILFGLYPYDQQWRPALAVILLLGLIVLSGNRRFWRPWLGAVWAAAAVVLWVLMQGGILGLPVVPNNKWGGLPLTLGLSVIGLGAAFPVGILLALGRRSTMPAIRGACIAFIELVRGVPLITVLFMASFLFPLFLPSGVNIDNLLRAQVGMILFAAAYLAEVVRGGLQAIPKGQYEAAASLGLSYWRAMRLVILPQALRISIPPLVNSFISFIKDTSLVIVIGLFDLLGTAKAALTDAAWRGFYREAYLFAGLIYFVICFTLSRYSQSLEKQVNVGVRRAGR